MTEHDVDQRRRQVLVNRAEEAMVDACGKIAVVARTLRSAGESDMADAMDDFYKSAVEARRLVSRIRRLV